MSIQLKSIQLKSIQLKNSFIELFLYSCINLLKCSHVVVFLCSVMVMFLCGYVVPNSIENQSSLILNGLSLCIIYQLSSPNRQFNSKYLNCNKPIERNWTNE